MRIVSARAFATALLLGCSILPLDHARAEGVPSSDPDATSGSGIGANPHLESSEPTPDRYWERLRIALERTALRYPNPEAQKMDGAEARTLDPVPD